MLWTKSSVCARGRSQSQLNVFVEQFHLREILQVFQCLHSLAGEQIVEQAQSHKRTPQSSVRQSQGKKQKKMTTTTKLATQMERICSAIESMSHARKFDPYKEIIETLKAISEIKQDKELYFFALDHFAEKKDNRQIFINMDGDQEKVKWLKYKFAQRSHH
ncbi:uncharacterized protein LOC130140740 [Syzygium oleosum]|uniref:uncharacterized protein LOC130140740 n=1 Tax=Syzygium oleosum TaxID=219896 RepID=UPI0024B9F5B7|nr:uncharacterized protein LOC130140740 [Syzygium oleosum]